MRFRRFIFSTRGVYLLAAQGVILWLKHRTGSGVSLLADVALLVVVLAAQIFRTWAAGFVGTTARGRVALAETLLTAGPYAYVRNPMYLGILVITTALAAMSGLWYGPPIAWALFAFVYSNVIPYEETYLHQRFGREYEAYYKAVPRLLPTWHGYARRQGVFRLREGLANEVVSWIGATAMAIAFFAL